MVEVLKNPCYYSFLNLLRNSEEEVLLCSPYIKKNIIEEILKSKKQTSNLRLITKSWLPDFISKSSDIEAIEILLKNNIEVFNYQRLHAKTYIFDKKKIIITSSNLTNGGLLHNFEYGVIISDDFAIDTILSDYDDMLNDKEICGQFNLATVNYIKQRIAKFPQNHRVILNSDGESSLTADDQFEIITSLFSWQRDVFEVICGIKESTFTLNDVFKFKDELSKKHPKNNNIEAKIRQQLQFLRDKGLILFISRGIYKKLW